MQTDAVGANRTVTVAVESWTALARKSYVPPIQKRPSATTPSVANRDTLLWRFWANITGRLVDSYALSRMDELARELLHFWYMSVVHFINACRRRLTIRYQIVAGLAIILALCSNSFVYAEQSELIEPFGEVHAYRPTSTVDSFVILVSGDGGWVHAVVDLASKLSAGKTFVAGIDIRQYLDGVKKTNQSCLNAGKDFQNLTETLRAKYSLPAGIQPALIGYSSGATLVYAAIAQSNDAFSGAVSFGFCPDFEYSKPFCSGQSLQTSIMPGGRGVYVMPDQHLQIPWIVFQGSTDQVCNPRVTKDFVQQVPSGEFVFLPRVGHGFADEKKWLPQFRHSFLQLHPIANAKTDRVPT